MRRTGARGARWSTPTTSWPSDLHRPSVRARSTRADHRARSTRESTSTQSPSTVRVASSWARGAAAVAPPARHAGGPRPPYEPVSGPDREGGSDDDEEVGGVHHGVGRVHTVRGDVLAEVDDVRLEHARAGRTVHHAEVGGVGEDGVRVGCHLDRAEGRHAVGEAGVEPVQVLVQRPAALPESAVEAGDHPVGAVQVHDPAAAGLEVQQVHILGDHPGHEAASFPVRQEQVRGVGPRGLHVPPPQVVARPVVAPEPGVAHELLERHRGAAGGVGAPVVGDSRGGGDPGAGEDGGPTAAQEAGERGGAVGQIGVGIRPLGGRPGGLAYPDHHEPPGPEGSCAQTTCRSPRRRAATAASREWVIPTADGWRAMTRSPAATTPGWRTVGSTCPRW